MFLLHPQLSAFPVCLNWGRVSEHTFGLLPWEDCFSLPSFLGLAVLEWGIAEGFLLPRSSFSPSRPCVLGLRGFGLSQ